MCAEKTESHDVTPYLGGLKFPADKDRVLEAALHNHAPKDVLDLLEHLRRDRFVVPQDVIEAYEEIRHHGDRGPQAHPAGGTQRP